MRVMGVPHEWRAGQVHDWVVPPDWLRCRQVAPAVLSVRIEAIHQHGSAVQYRSQLNTS
jgi:hypothetical protein